MMPHSALRGYNCSSEPKPGGRFTVIRLPFEFCRGAFSQKLSLLGAAVAVHLANCNFCRGCAIRMMSDGFAGLWEFLHHARGECLFSSTTCRLRSQVHLVLTHRTRHKRAHRESVQLWRLAQGQFQNAASRTWKCNSNPPRSEA